MPAVALTYSSRGRDRYTSSAVKDQKQRDALVMTHAPMVRRVALHMVDRLEGNLDPDDLIQSGLLGLLEAASRYCAMDSIPFEAYALPRIRGAMVDSLRRNDWCSRELRRQQRHIRSVYQSLTRTLERPPTDTEMAEAAAMDINEYHRVHASLESASLTSLDALLEKGESLLPSQGDITARAVFRHDMQTVLADALRQLPEREQMIIQLYYHEELNQKEIAQVLDLTEARISQLRNKAVKSLRRKLME